MRSELSEERPPPLGDIVSTAMNDGRRTVRRRRLAAAGSAVAVAAVVAAGALVAWPSGGGGSAVLPAAPGTASGSATEPATEPAPQGSAKPRMSEAPATPEMPESKKFVRDLHGTRGAGKQVRATPQSVLALLVDLLPEGKVSKLAANADFGLFAQVYLDTGDGPRMVRVWLRDSQPKLPAGKVEFTTFRLADNCVQDQVVNASYSTGGHVEMAISTCLDDKAKPTKPLLTVDEAVEILSDARWGTKMAVTAVAAADNRYHDVPREAR